MGTTVLPATTSTRLSDVRGLARPKVGLLPAVADADDPYLDLWPTAITAARDQLLMEIPARRVASESQASINIDGTGTYDLNAYEFLRVDRVGLSTGTSAGTSTVDWLYLHGGPTAAVYADRVFAKTGTPSAVTFDGVLLALLPVEDDATLTLIVQGVRVPATLSASTDGTGLTRLCNEAIAAGAAMRAIGYDIEREDHRLRLPLLAAEWDRLVGNLRGVLLRNRAGRGGWKTAPAVTDSPAQGSQMPGAFGGTAPVSLTAYLTQTDWYIASEGETEVAFDVSAAPVAPGHEAGVMVWSAWRGPLSGTTTVSEDNNFIGGHTGIDPDTSAYVELMTDEPVRALYMAVPA